MDLIADQKADCGCWRKEWYDHDPNFSGYDTERSERKEGFCADHNQQLQQYRLACQSLQDQVSLVRRQLKTKQAEVQKFKKDLFNSRS